MALTLAAALASLAIGVATTVPDGAPTLAAVFPPWWPASQRLLAASRAGAVVSTGTSSAVLIVRATAPGLGPRLRAAGAILLLNPLAAGACGQNPTEDVRHV